MPESIEDMLNSEFNRFSSEHAGYSKEDIEAKLKSIESRMNKLWQEVRELVNGQD